jgi:hypothetical protein
MVGPTGCPETSVTIHGVTFKTIEDLVTPRPKAEIRQRKPKRQQTDQIKSNKTNLPKHAHKKVSWITYEITVSEIKSLRNSHELIYTGNQSAAPG